MKNFKESVAFYLRKSRMDDESESVDETLARHADTLMKLADRMGLNITEVYKEVVSGDGLFTRPEMVRLLQDVEQDKYSAICCMEIDRLGRSAMKDSGLIFETLQEHNVFIVTPNKTYDLNDDIDNSSVEMQSFIARQELKAIRRRLRKGVEKSCESGYHVTEPPYGYRRTYVDKHPTLEIHEEEARVVKMIFDMYVNSGMGSSVIADTLNGMGYRPRKNDHFSRSTISFYLQNPTYIGKIVWNRQRRVKKKSPADKNRYLPNDEDKWIVADGIHPAIVSQEIFSKAQRIRLTRSHPPSYTGTLQNPFAGLIFCKNCGHAMQRQFSAGSGNRLLCANTSCNRGIKTIHVEKYVLKILRQTLASCKSTLENHVQDEAAKKIDNINLTIRSLRKNLTVFNTQKSSLHDLLEKGIYDAPTFLERSKILAEKIKNVDTAINIEHQKLLNLQKNPPLKEAVPLLEKLLNNYERLTAAEKNEMLKILISRITYLRTKDMEGQDFELEIEFKYNI